MSDDDIWALKRGGHDYRKIYAAYAAATAHTGQPTVILAHTIKGYGLGSGFAGRNATHQMKKLKVGRPQDAARLAADPDHRRADRRRPVRPAVLPPGPGRAGDPVHARAASQARRLRARAPQRRQEGDRCRTTRSTTCSPRAPATRRSPRPWRSCACSRTSSRTRSSGTGSSRSSRTRPARSAWTRSSPRRRSSTPRARTTSRSTASSCCRYKESEAGQIMHTGINEAGSAAAFQAVGTSYATHNEPLVPFYFYYSMFGFQRTGDQFWAAGDQLTRGFLIGATAGRTTLTGEGLQHADGHSPLLAGTMPHVVHYDPAYGYEIRHIVRDGLQRMYGDGDGRGPERHLLPDGLQRADDPAGRAGGRRRRGHPARHPPHLPGRGRGPARPDPRLRRRRCRGRSRPSSCWPTTGACAPRLVRDELERAAPRRPRGRAAGVPAPGRRSSARRTSRRSSPAPRARSSRRRDYDHLVADQVRAWIPGGTRRSARTGSGSPTPGRRPAATSTSTARRTAVRVLQQLAREGAVPGDVPAQAIERYRLHDVNAGTSGNTGGDS